MRFFYKVDAAHANAELFNSTLLQMGVIPIMQWSDANNANIVLREVNKPLPQIVLDLLAGQENGSPLLVNRRLRDDRATDQAIIAPFNIGN